MRPSEIITKAIDALYIRPIAAVIPRQIFRYGVCGGSNMILDSVWYFIIYPASSSLFSLLKAATSLSHSRLFMPRGFSTRTLQPYFSAAVACG